MNQQNHSRRRFIKNGASALAGGYFILTWPDLYSNTSAKKILVWVETRDFTNYGGWRLDTQFMDMAGAAYLLAAGTGDPVKDASTNIRIEKSGRYTLWVRSKNWLPDFSPGQFNVILNDRLAGLTSGMQPKEKWTWEKAGEFDLPEGDLKISLNDLTGHYGRCSTVILTTDKDFNPPEEVNEMMQLRSKMTRVGAEPADMGNYDVIVTGAGAAGCCAALAAARGGARTALIDNRDKPGGNFYLGVPLNGATILHKNARETGIVEEISRLRSYHRTSGTEVLSRLLEAEPKLSVFLNQFVSGVEKDGDQRITGLETIGTGKYNTFRYRGRIFIDCTGDGWTGYFAGAESRYGRESRFEFNEDHAPEKADKITMSGVLFKEAFIYKAVDMKKEMVFRPPEWAYKFPDEKEFHRKIASISYGNWWLEHRGTVNDLWDAEGARDDLLRITYGYWDYIKNIWGGREKARTYGLQTVATTLAKRETRRLVGDHILTQNDVLDNVFFEDRISYGGWPLDVHHPEGIFSGKEGPYEYNTAVPIYQIPFRCLYSGNIDNLLFAGRDMSATHVALGTVRVQKTLACLGQVTGIAAALCMDKDIMPRELGARHVETLQQECLKKDLYIPDLVNQDPDDLARKCRLSASSTSTAECFGKEDFVHAGYLPLDRMRAMIFPRGLYEELDSIYLRLSTNNPEETKITLTLLDQSTGEVVAVSKGSIPKDHAAFYNGDLVHGTSFWVRFRIGRKIPAKMLMATLPETSGIWWPMMKKAPSGSLRAEKKDPSEAWTLTEKEYHAFYTNPGITLAGKKDAPSADEPENVINGITRVIGERTNMWASDPAMELPQWIELDFGRPVDFNTVQVCFDTNLDINDAHLNEFRPMECVRDYQLSYYDGSQWKEIMKVRDNILRYRAHRFDPVYGSKMRMTILSTHGDLSARVYEIRVYNEKKRV